MLKTNTFEDTNPLQAFNVKSLPEITIMRFSMQKKRKLPSLLLVFGFVVLILAAIALPSATEDKRSIIAIVACAGGIAILSGIVLSFKKDKKP